MAITNARMQIKRGNEVDFDAEKMLVGEWALSTDKRIVRICVAPNVCIRMATYDAFEADVAKIQGILEEVQTIEEAVTRINTEISEKANAVSEYTEQAKGYRDETKQFRDGAETSATNAKSSEDKAKASETNAKVSETNAKISEENAQRVAESLPEDYTDLSKAFYNTAIKQKAVGENIHVTDSAEARNVEFGLYGKAEQNGEPTPDNKVDIVISGASGSVGVVSCGKNLVDCGTFTCNANEQQTIDIGSVSLKKGQTVTVSCIQNETLTSCLRNTFQCGFDGSIKYESTSGNYNLKSGKRAWTLTALKDGVYSFLLWCHSPNITLSCSEFQLEKGTVATEYQPYTETTSTIPTPNGLAGIKVSSGGNYTDENGQQWICDEIVKYADGSGKRIQRIGKEVLNGSEDWSLNTINDYGISNFNTKPKNTAGNTQISSHFIYDGRSISLVDSPSFNVTSANIFLRMKSSDISSVDALKTWLASNNVSIMYELAEPIITDLTAEEIAEIEKLYTFYPITNISNDADCGMSITYLCDAKNYIDNRLALIESAMLNNI